MRLFIAIELPQHIRLYLIRMQEALRPVFGGKWTRPAQLHITLKFLGETPDAQLPDLIGVLSEVELDTEILLQSKGVLYLPPHGPVRIVAAGFEDVAGAASELAERIDLACHEVGYRLEGREWTPHVTLARLKNRPEQGWRERAAAADIGSGPEFVVDQFVLMESRLDREGPQFTVAAHFPRD